MLTRGMAAYISQRLVLIVFTVFAVSSIVFLAIHQLPGDALFNEHLHGNEYQQKLHYYGLDKPLYQQYLTFLGNLFFHGDLGESLVLKGVKITPVVLREFQVSAEIGVVALMFTIGLGMVFGIVAAIRQNTWID